MPFAIGGNQLDTTFSISNSLRFNRGDSPNLERTFSGSPTSTKKCTISFWLKLADPNDTNAKNIFSAIKSGTNEDFIKFMGVNNGILNNLELGFNNTIAGGLMSTGAGSSDFFKFRDPSAWYNICVAIDSSQGTADNRVKLYVNGNQIGLNSRVEGGSQIDDTPLTQDYELGFLTASKHQIGENVDGSGEHFDGYLSEFYFVDGQQLAPTTFSERNDNGVWVPKDAKDDITFGNYGFFLEFKQTGTSADASGMGADTSGNDNHFSASGLAAVDVTTDTPSNNFATLNPLIVPSEDNAPTLSEGNCRVVTSDNGSFGGLSTIGVSSGKWYAEFKYITASADNRAVVAVARDLNPFNTSDTSLGEDANSISYRAVDGGSYNNNSVSSYGSSYAAGDIIGVALDLDNLKLYFSKNGTFQNSGNPESGSTGTGALTASLSAGEFHFIGCGDVTSSFSETLEANFGNAPFTISTPKSDANGHGNFEFDVPSGYFALCTKNLAEYG
tara:strand:- start:9 stop:1508 length:1500 start_codon:yes stop_codon:yes gene_type:complete